MAKTMHLFCSKWDEKNNLTCIDKISFGDFYKSVRALNDNRRESEPKICKGCKIVGIQMIQTEAKSF